MPLRASIDLGNEYFRVEHISDAKDVKTALAGFSAGKRAAGLELYLKKSALTDEAECDARTYLVRDVVTDEIAVYFSLRTCLVPFQFGDGSMYTIPGIELSNFARNVNYRSGHKGVSVPALRDSGKRVGPSASDGRDAHRPSAKPPRRGVTRTGKKF